MAVSDPVTVDDFDEQVLAADGPVVVYFTAEWCGPCKRFKPIFVDRAGDVDLPFAVVDISDESDPLWERFDIRQVPTVAVFAGGEIRERVSGFLDERDLDELLGRVET